MNKKLFSAALFGALLLGTASTFVSCKDYDDDIQNLQAQIDSQKGTVSAVETSLSGKVSAVESSISSLSSAQSSIKSEIADAKSAAAAAQTAAEKADANAKVAALEAQQAAIAAAADELKATKADLEKAIAEYAAAASKEAAATASAASKETAEAVAAAKKEAAAAVAAAAKAADAKIAEVAGRVETLEAFAVTTGETLEALAKADNDLAVALVAAKEELNAAIASGDAAVLAKVAATDATVAEQAALIGKNAAAIEAQIAALEALKANTGESVEGMLDKLAAVQTAIEEQKAALESYVDESNKALKAALESYVDESNKALNSTIAANKDALAAAIATNKEALDEYVKSNDDEIASLKATVSALQTGQLSEEQITKLAAEVTKEYGTKIALMEAIYNKMITNVSLIKTLDDSYKNWPIDLNLVSSKAVRTWTFGAGMPGAIQFKEGDTETFEDSFVIRVSPTNAVVDESVLKLVNSQLGDLDDLLDMSIEPYTKLLTRGISANGLWKITVKLKKNYDQDAYVEASGYWDNVANAWKSTLYAVMAGDEDRMVVSEYGLTLSNAAHANRRELNFNVDNTPVAQIHNRWDGTRLIGETGTTQATPTEKTWNMKYTSTPPSGGYYDFAPWAAPVWTGSKQNVVAASSASVTAGTTLEDDARYTKDPFQVVAGKTFTVKLPAAVANDIRAFYVALDEDCAIESAPSEINAWNSYGIKGLYEVTEGNSIDLTIPEDANAEGDWIGFRVFAVNYDGSLVDPDGKAFYVYVGDIMPNTFNVNWTWTANGISNQTKVAVPEGFLKALQGVTYSETFATDTVMNAANTDLVVNAAAFTITYWNLTGSTWTPVALSSTTANTVTHISVRPTVDATWFDDGKTYASSIVWKNSLGIKLQTMKVNFTKVLPTGFPRAFSAKTNAINNGVLTVYPTPNTSGNGDFDLNSAFNGLTTLADIKFITTDPGLVGTATSTPAWSDFKIATVGTDHMTAADNSNSYKLTDIDAGIVNNGKTYDMKASYNYGPISSQKNAAGNYNYMVDWGTTFKVKFDCMIVASTFSWTATPVVYYNEDTDVFGAITYNTNGTVKSVADVLSVKNAYQQVVNPFSDSDTKWTDFAAVLDKTTQVVLKTTHEDGTVVNNEFYSNAGFVKLAAPNKDGSSSTEKAYGLKLTTKSNNVVLSGDVPTDVYVKVTDKFGHPHEVKVGQFIMKKSH